MKIERGGERISLLVKRKAGDDTHEDETGAVVVLSFHVDIWLVVGNVKSAASSIRAVRTVSLSTPSHTKERQETRLTQVRCRVFRCWR